MKFLVLKNGAKTDIKNAYSKTALEEFKDASARLTADQKSEITNLLTPPASTLSVTSAVAAPKLASSAPASLVAPAAATDMSVDEFCTIAYGDGADTKIKEAIDSGRATREVTGTEFVTTGKGIGNTAMYCACRSPKTTVVSIKLLVNSVFWNVNKQNNHNASTPLHGLVERLKEPDSDVSGIIEIMKFLVAKKVDRTLANIIENGGTALREFNGFKTKFDHLKSREVEITVLLTPTVAEIVEAADKAFFEKLCTHLQVPELETVIAKHYEANTKTWTTNRGDDGNATWESYIRGVMDELSVQSAHNTRTFKPEFADIPDVANVGTMLRATTVGDIEKEYLRFFELAKLLPPKKASFTIVGPFIDGKYALKSKLAINSIVQVASQFDFLESVSSDYAEITAYPHDRTQGPGSSMASLEALILRDAAIKPPTRDGTLQKLGQQPIFNGIQWYKNGYLEPHKELDESKLRETAKSITDNIGTLKILAQESVPEIGKGSCIQVFSAAPSYQSYGQVHVSAPAEGSAGAKICEDLVLAQYMSIARLAVIKSIAEPSQKVNLHLTAVGQGAFNNPPLLYDKFIAAVWEIVKSFNVGVYMHVFGSDKDPYDRRVTALNALFTKIDSSAKTASGELPKLDADQFIAHK